MTEPSEFLNSISEPADCAFLHRLDGLDRLIESIDKLTTVMSQSTKQPDFRPLHIEDGQIQETIPKWMQEARAQTFGSVPEAELQEHEPRRDPLNIAIDQYASWVLTEERAHARGSDDSHGQLAREIAKAREAIFAAHREYAQPYKPAGSASMELGRITDTLRACVKRHDLRRHGERLDIIVCEALDKALAAQPKKTTSICAYGCLHESGQFNPDCPRHGLPAAQPGKDV